MLNLDVPFHFADYKSLRESGFAIDGVTVNGFVNEKGVTVNVNSPKALNSVVGHEITHVLEGTKLYDSLKKAVKAWGNTKGIYETRLKELTELYQGKKGYTGEEAAAKIEREVVADLIGDYLFTDKAFVENLAKENPGLFQRIFEEIKYLCKLVTAGSKEARQLEKVKKIFQDVYRAEIKNPTAEGGTKYALSEYTDTQKENWKNSKKIVVYENDAQLLQFVRDSLANKDASNKMYLGVISGDLAKRIKTETGLDFEGKNAVIRAKNIRKIVLHDHGNPSAEKLRGQIAVTDTDFLAIKDIFGDPDTIKLEEKGYEGKPAATFEKVIGPKKYTMFVVDSGGSLDVFVQTMYIHKNKNGSIANVANAKALTSTPKATVGTAPTNNVQHNNPSVNNKNSLSVSGQAESGGQGWQVRGRDVALEQEQEGPGVPMPPGYQKGNPVAGATQKGSKASQTAREEGLPMPGEPARVQSDREDGNLTSPEDAAMAEQRRLDQEFRQRMGEEDPSLYDTDEDEGVETTRDKLEVRRDNLRWELQEKQRGKEAALQAKDRLIQELQAKYDAKKHKDSKNSRAMRK